MWGEIDDTLRLYCVWHMDISTNTALDYPQITWEEQVITRNNDDGSVTFIFESWDELIKSEPKWEPDADLWAKDRADERANDY